MWSDSNEYTGVISFNRRIYNGEIFNPKFYGYQLSNIKGNMELNRFAPNGTEAGGHLGIFGGASADYDVRIYGTLRSGATKLDSLQLGDAKLYYENGVLKIDGATVVAERDVIALGSAESESGTIEVDNILCGDTLTIESEVMNVSSGAEMKISSGDVLTISSAEDITIQQKSFAALVYKLNQLLKAANIEEL
jgi:hypothetical protein